MHQKKVAVLGAGQMGGGIAHVFAHRGWSVQLVDVAQPLLDKALAAITGNFDRQIKKGTVTAADRDAALARIAPGTDLGVVADRELIIEAATENAVLKFKLFADIDRVAPPEAILA